ncbi:MAG TPA: CHAD domain-containing protein [Lysobacter sp.]
MSDKVSSREAGGRPARVRPPPGPSLSGYAAGELDAARAALAGDDLHEGVHQARKALRRARAALALGDGILGPGAGLIDRELREINEGLSTLRDAHALVETLDRLIRRERHAGRRAVLDRARADAVRARDEHADGAVLLDPGLRGRIALIDVLQAALPVLTWDRLTPSALRMGLADSDDRTLDARERALASGKDKDWHRWRRRARRASQQRRALAAVGVKAPAATHGFDKRTTERLGEAQDLSLLLAHCGRGSPFSKDDRLALRAHAQPALERLRRRISRRVAEQAQRLSEGLNDPIT